MMRSKSVGMMATSHRTGDQASLRYRDEEAHPRAGARDLSLTIEGLGAHLTDPLLPIYLVSGDEPLLVGEAADAIRARARAADFSERQIFFVERSASVWEDIRQAAQALSLFSANRLVEI